jgi:hypothetical protein
MNWRGNRSFDTTLAGPRRMVCALLFAISAFAMAATSTSSTYAGAGSNNDDRWRRVELSSGQVSPGAISQITVAIETRGPRLSGRIRIPGGIASNFETAGGRAVVDLINVGGAVTGYADIAAIEIQFSEVTADQPFIITTLGFETK